MTCKTCEYFNNKVPVGMTHNPNDKHKTAEPYIGRCTRTGCIKMMNDTCRLYKEVKQDDTRRGNQKVQL